MLGCFVERSVSGSVFPWMLELRALIFVLSLCCLQTSFADSPVTDKSISSSSNTSEWLAYGRIHNEQGYSTLEKSTRKT